MTPPVPVSATAETVYAAARPRLLQIRTLLSSAGKQSSLGSGFLVTADGLAITNYHVVSQYALEPATYRMEYATPDGAKGVLKLLAVDVTNDLAVVQLDKNDYPFFMFNPRAIDGSLPKGERMYAMGNPHDIGFTIVEGTYNNLVDKSYQERIHFSGAMNPGMSGGPTVSVDGRVIGINVAKRVGSDLVSFLVPACFGAALLDRARQALLDTPQGAQDLALTPEKTRVEIGKQLSAWQAALYKSCLSRVFGAPHLAHIKRQSRSPRGLAAGREPMLSKFPNRVRCSIQHNAIPRHGCLSATICKPARSKFRTATQKVLTSTRFNLPRFYRRTITSRGRAAEDANMSRKINAPRIL